MLQSRDAVRISLRLALQFQSGHVPVPQLRSGQCHFVQLNVKQLIDFRILRNPISEHTYN
jgi:hypothetical protein